MGNIIIPKWYIILFVFLMGVYSLREFLKYEYKLEFTPIRFLGVSILSFVFVILSIVLIILNILS
jgi:hypothetical protein